MGARLQASLGLSLGARRNLFVYNARRGRAFVRDEDSLEDELGAEGVAYSCVLQPAASTLVSFSASPRTSTQSSSRRKRQLRAIPGSSCCFSKLHIDHARGCTINHGLT